MGRRHRPPPRSFRPVASDAVGRGWGRRLLPFQSTAKQTLLLPSPAGAWSRGHHPLASIAAGRGYGRWLPFFGRCAATGKPLPPVESHCYMPAGSHFLPSTTGGPKPPPLPPVFVWSRLNSLVGRATLPFVAATAGTLKGPTLTATLR